MKVLHNCHVLGLLMMSIVVAGLMGCVAQAQTYTVLHSFDGPGDGAAPWAGLTMDRGGNLYGTTTGGGFDCDYGCGNVFKMTHHNSSWIFTRLYNFTGPTGVMPVSRVVFGPDGALYGTTSAGGTMGGGTAYKLTPPANVCPSVSCPWTITVLHLFDELNNDDDGAFPQYGDLIFDSSGNIYGTTMNGYGGTCSFDQTCGGVFELSFTPQGGWTANPIFKMANYSGGYWPNSGVAFDSAGHLYGTTAVNNASIFELTNGGGNWSATPLYNFEDTGSNLTGTPILDASGNLYDDIAQGVNGGSVYELSPNGNGGWYFNTIYTFSGNGPGPVSTLTMDSAGNLYGVTYLLGAHNFGNVFKLTRNGNTWSYSSLYDFTGGTDGGQPFGQVILDSAGNIYGTTTGGGTTGNGVVFEITQPN